MATLLETSIQYGGAAAFGAVVGWITYRTLRRREDKATLADIAAVIAAVGGGAVTALFQGATLFGMYSLGLAGGFFGYLAVARGMERSEPPPSTPTSPAGGPPPTPGTAPATPQPERASDWMGR